MVLGHFSNLVMQYSEMIWHCVDVRIEVEVAPIE